MANRVDLRERLRRRIRSTTPVEFLRVMQWRGRSWASPAPFHVKRRVLERYGCGADVWIESGTYKGDMTDFLVTLARRTVTIEPMPHLYALAKKRFEAFPSVTVVNGASQDVLPDLLSECAGVVSFWLDGHWDGNDYTYRGELEVPILAELRAISDARHHLGAIRVFIDDVRLFTFHDQGVEYPELRKLVEWAENEGLSWWIEHDIFCAVPGEDLRGLRPAGRTTVSPEPGDPNCSGELQTQQTPERSRDQA